MSSTRCSTPGSPSAVPITVRPAPTVTATKASSTTDCSCRQAARGSSWGIRAARRRSGVCALRCIRRAEREIAHGFSSDIASMGTPNITAEMITATITSPPPIISTARPPRRAASTIRTGRISRHFPMAGTSRRVRTASGVMLTRRNPAAAAGPAVPSSAATHRAIAHQGSTRAAAPIRTLSTCSPPRAGISAA